MLNWDETIKPTDNKLKTAPSDTVLAHSVIEIESVISDSSVPETGTDYQGAPADDAGTNTAPNPLSRVISVSLMVKRISTNWRRSNILGPGISF